MVEENDLAYVAGFFDGEGMATICRWNGLYRPYVRIYNNNRSVLEWIRRVLGGGKVKRRSNGPRYFMLDFNVGDMRRVLPRLLPFLRVKRGQVRLLLEFLEFRRNGTSLCHTDNSYYNCKCREFYEEMRLLNRRIPAEMVEQMLAGSA
jgi:hypothetical protein